MLRSSLMKRNWVIQQGRRQIFWPHFLGGEEISKKEEYTEVLDTTLSHKCIPNILIVIHTWKPSIQRYYPSAPYPSSHFRTVFPRRLLALSKHGSHYSFPNRSRNLHGCRHSTSGWSRSAAQRPRHPDPGCRGQLSCWPWGKRCRPRGAARHRRCAGWDPAQRQRTGWVPLEGPLLGRRPLHMVA